MKNTEKDLMYLKHIIQFIEEVEHFSANGFDKEDKIYLRAIERCVENIGEAANHLSEDLQNKYNNIPWEDIVGFRNRLVHNYFSYDVNFLWESVEKDIPILKTEIKKILEILEDKNN